MKRPGRILYVGSAGVALVTGALTGLACGLLTYDASSPLSEWLQLVEANTLVPASVSVGATVAAGVFFCFVITEWLLGDYLRAEGSAGVEAADAASAESPPEPRDSRRTRERSPPC